MKKYEKYKDSGIEWIGEIPEHWEVKRFSFLFSLGRGLSITKQDLKDSGIPCVSYGEIHSKFGFKVNPEINELKYVDEDYLNSSTNSLLKRGDFVFADTSEDIEGSGNFTCLDSDIPTFAGYHTIIARLKYNFNYRFIAYHFDSLEYRTQIQKEVSGIKVFSITQAILKNTNLILPTVQEQTTIATFLDRKTTEIDHIIANKQKLIALYEEEKQAIINQAVTKGLDPNVKMKDSGVEWLGEIPEHWEVKKLMYLVRILSGYSPEQCQPTDNGEIEYIKVDDVDKNIFEVTNPSSYTSKKFIVSIGQTILFPKRGAAIALNKVGVVNRPICFDTNLMGLKLISVKNEVFYIAYLLKSFSLISIADTSTIPQINNKHISPFQIPIPPLNEQRDILEHINNEYDKLNNIIAKVKKQIALLQEYRTTLISEVVTGKVKVCG